MTIVTGVGDLAILVEERLFLRIRISVAVWSETEFLEVFRVASDVFGDVVSAGLVTVFVAGQERIVCIAEDVWMRAVRAPIPPKTRTFLIDNPEAGMI